MLNDWETPPTVEGMIVRAWIGEAGQPDVMHVQGVEVAADIGNLAFDMRGGQGRQPLDVPLDGRVRHHCVFARMPGVFEPCTRLDHLGWLRYLASQTPLSRSIGSLASCSATGPFGSW